MNTHEKALRDKVPQHTLAALDRYVNECIPPGGFLEAVLTNNLFEAYGRADEMNRESLFSICEYIYNYIPCGAWGNQKAVTSWLKGDKR